MPTKKSKHPKMDNLLFATKQGWEVAYMVRIYAEITKDKVLEIAKEFKLRSTKDFHAKVKELGYVRKPKKVKVK